MKENAGNDVTAQQTTFDISFFWNCFILPMNETCKKCLQCSKYRHLHTIIKIAELGNFLANLLA